MRCQICDKPVLVTGIQKDVVSTICHVGHKSEFKIMPNFVAWATDLFSRVDSIGLFLSSARIEPSHRSLITSKIFELLAEAVSAARDVEVQEAKEPAPPIIRIYTDGSCHPNPGPAGCGVVLISSQGGIDTRLETLEIALPTKMTNNEAEYMGVIEGLKLASQRGYRKVIVHSDSELVLKQLAGSYKIGEKLKGLHQRVLSFVDIAKMEVEWVQIRGDDNPAHTPAEAAYKAAEASFKLKEARADWPEQQ